MGESGKAAAGKGLNKTQVILIIGFILIIAAIGVGFYILTHQPEEAAGGNLLITEDNLGEVEQQLADQIARGAFETYMNMKWTFPNGSSPSSDAVIGNSASNRFDFYFDIMLAETNQIVFTSGVIPVGRRLMELTLTEDLPAGNYPALITYHMIDENGEVMESDVSFSVEIVVES